MGFKVLTFGGGLQVLGDQDGYVLVDDHGNAMMSMASGQQKLLTAPGDITVLADESDNALVDQDVNVLLAESPSKGKKLLCFNLD